MNKRKTIISALKKFVTPNSSSIRKSFFIIILLFLPILKAEERGNVSAPNILPELIVREKYNLRILSKELGKIESSNNYLAVNRFGYMGKYQFSMKSLKTIEIKVNRINFLRDSVLQEEAFERLLEYNYAFLERNGVLEKVGTKSVDGFVITVEGLLAASHLCGSVSVYDYVMNGNVENRVIYWGGYKCRVYKTDGNNTKIQKYFQLFSTQ